MQSVQATVEEYPALVQTVLRELPNATNQASVLALSGDLGAGKTTFTQVLAKELGVIDQVTSPTFVVQKIYPTNSTHWSSLVHMDAYRIEDESELRPLNLVTLWRDPTVLVVIEWPERLGAQLPADALVLRFTTLNETTRVIEFPASK